MRILRKLVHLFTMPSFPCSFKFNRDSDGLRPLPNVHVDTGLGLERICSVLQNKSSNYDTDMFMPYFKAIEAGTSVGRPYTGKVGDDDTDGIDMAYRVLADHIRTLTIAICDGGVPDNVGRGYVLRLILRRAIRFGDEKLGAPPGFFATLAPIVKESLGEHFTELTDTKIAYVMEVLNEEETTFRKTLTRGRRLFEREALKASGTGKMDGVTAFRLHDTYGFPIDLTKVMAQEKGLEIDFNAYEKAVAEAKLISQGGADAAGKKVDMDVNAIGDLNKKGVPGTDDQPKYDYKVVEGKYTFGSYSANVLAIRTLEGWIDEAATGAHVGLVLDKTSFYAEQGGQIYDTGYMTSTDESNGLEFTVSDVQKKGAYCLHVGIVQDGTIKVGDCLNLVVDTDRRVAVTMNHTATHILNFGLRKALAPADADQKGSLVEPDRLRFDFTAKKALTVDQLRVAEIAAREVVASDVEICAKNVPLGDAMEVKGLRAMFGEKYPDPVRMVTVGVPVDDLIADPKSGKGEQFSVEFCGGTHSITTGDIGAFAIVSEEAIAKGVRRVVCVTGVGAQRAIALAEEIDATVHDKLTREEVTSIGATVNQATLPTVRKAEIRAKLDAVSKKLLEVEKAAQAKITAVAIARADEIVAEKPDLIVEHISVGANSKALNQGLQKIKKGSPNTSAMFFGCGDGALVCICLVPKTINKGTGFSAKEWLNEVAAITGGKCGGSNEVAQCSSTDEGKLEEAIAAANAYAKSKLGQ